MLQIIRLLLLASTLALLVQCSETSAKYPKGATLYKTHCSTCHTSSGAGVGELYPAINQLGTQSDYPLEDIHCYIRLGKNSGDRPVAMAPIQGVSDEDIHNIINYLIADLNKMEKTFSIEESTQLLGQCR